MENKIEQSIERPIVSNKQDLLAYWASFNDEGEPLDQISFNGGESFKEFSNWFAHEKFEFELPQNCIQEQFRQNKLVMCEHTEKALMLSKAACLGDKKTFDLIMNCVDQEKCKKLGRQIQPWNRELWNKNVVQIAVSMCVQKFTKVEGLKEVLLSTGDSIIAEATSEDKIWGTGFEIGHEFEKVPSEWVKMGSFNIMGFALMQARDIIRQNDYKIEQSVDKRENFTIRNAKEIYDQFIQENYSKKDHLITNVVQIINDAYMKGEKGMWKEPQQNRTCFEDLAKFVEENKVLLAFSKSDDLADPIASVIFTTRQTQDNKKHGEIGMLAAKLDKRGKGVGRALITACEERAKKEGCDAVQLEILQPSEWQHPAKGILHTWYSERLGYIQGVNRDFSKEYPQLIPLLAGPTKYTEYVKQL